MNWANTYGIFAAASAFWFLAGGFATVVLTIATWDSEDITKRAGITLLSLIWVVQLTLFGFAVYAAGMS